MIFVLKSSWHVFAIEKRPLQIDTRDHSLRQAIKIRASVTPKQRADGRAACDGRPVDDRDRR